MRVSQSVMDQNHERIVKGASRLMRKQGIEATSVHDFMREAGLTHGGFYRHFDSKESLVSAALTDAFHEVIEGIEESYRADGVGRGAGKYFEHYLSEGHVKHPELGCPIAALSMDVARGPECLKDTFAENFSNIVAKLGQAADGTVEENQASAIRKLCMAAGAVMIARASNPKMARSVLRACRSEM